MNLTNNERIVVVDHNGTAIVNYSPSSPSASNNSTKLENFGYLNSVKALAFEIVNGTKILSIYQPIQLDNRFWGVVLMRSVISHNKY